MKSANDLLERNLLSLSISNPVLSARVRDSEPDPHYRLETSRSGLPIPGLIADGHLRCFHSRMDPEREAERLTAERPHGGYHICFGLGAGYIARSLLSRNDLSGLLILDLNIRLLRAVLETVDLHSLFIDPRVRLLVDPSPDELRSVIFETYLPAVSGTLGTITLRSRTTLDSAAFESLAEVIRTVIDEVADDYGVQSYFGKRWFTNILANLPDAAKDSTTIGPVRKAWVVAAGPSLEDHLYSLRNAKGDTIISTDTALRTLLDSGIVPDMVVTIDCQHVSYHHFLGGFPGNVPLVLDLASPPVVARRARRRAFFSSGHPLSRYVGQKMRNFPLIDTSGGNVTHAAVSLADSLGAREIMIVGADFSYPDGKTYARGTYLYPYFSASSNRRRPLESQFFSFLFRGGPVGRERTDEGLRYTTRTLSNYRDRLNELVAGLNARVVPVPGKGLPVQTHEGKNAGERDTRTIFAPGPTKTSWIEFVRRYSEDVAALPDPGAGWGKYYSTLTVEERSLVATILPVTAAIRRELAIRPPSGRSPEDHEISLTDLFERTQSWITAALARTVREADR